MMMIYDEGDDDDDDKDDEPPLNCEPLFIVSHLMLLLFVSIMSIT
jgi:hypothetical protein